MKALTLAAALALVPMMARAEMPKKEPLKADFHSMIVNSYQERATLATEVSDGVTNAPAPVAQTSAAKKDAKRVTDFVDVEIGWGEAPKMVDRRFDSVEAAALNKGH